MERTDSQTSVISKRSVGSSAITADTFSHSEASNENTKESDRWRDPFYFLFYYFAYTFSWKNVGFLFYEDHRGNVRPPTFLHILTVYVFFGGPLLFIEIFIGQYTQRGCLFLGAKLPIAYGVGYCMLLLSIVDCCLNLYFASILVYYVFVAMMNYPTPAWMLCLPELLSVEPNCFSLTDIDRCEGCDSGKNSNPCFNGSVDVFSAELFFKLIILQMETNTSHQDFLGLPQKKQTFHLFISFLICYLLSSRRLLSMHKQVLLCGVYVGISFIMTTLMIMMYSGSSAGFEIIFQPDYESYISLDTWFASFLRVIRTLHIGEGGNLFFGSQIPLTADTEARVMSLSFFHAVASIIINVEALMVVGVLSCRLNARIENLRLETIYELTFVAFPTIYGTLAAPQFWSSLHLIVLFVLSMNSSIIQVIIIEESLSQEFNWELYYSYIRFLFLFILFFMSVPLTSTQGFPLAVEISSQQDMLTLVTICLFFMIIFTRGLQKFSDDVHFLLRVPPSLYVKTSWTVSSLVCAFGAGKAMHEYIKRHDKRPITEVMMALFFLPLIIAFLFKFWVHLKARNLMGLLMASKEYGPPDQETRTMRVLFNPRFEVKFRRRKDTCKHRCLLDSVILKRTLEKELALITTVVLGLEDHEEEILRRRNTIAILRRHRDLMSNFITERENIK